MASRRVYPTNRGDVIAVLVTERLDLTLDLLNDKHFVLYIVNLPATELEKCFKFSSAVSLLPHPENSTGS